MTVVEEANKYLDSLTKPVTMFRPNEAPTIINALLKEEFSREELQDALNQTHEVNSELLDELDFTKRKLDSYVRAIVDISVALGMAATADTGDVLAKVREMVSLRDAH